MNLQTQFIDSYTFHEVLAGSSRAETENVDFGPGYDLHDYNSQTVYVCLSCDYT